MISTWVSILWRTCPTFGALEGYQRRGRPKATKRRKAEKETESAGWQTWNEVYVPTAKRVRVYIGCSLGMRKS